ERATLSSGQFQPATHLQKAHDIYPTLRAVSCLNRAPFLIRAGNKLRLDGKFLGRQTHCISGRLLIDALDLVKNPAWLDYSYPVLWCTLAFAHTGFSRLLGNRLIREHANPDFAAALDMTGHRNSRRFNLPIRNPGRLQTLQPIFTKADLAATRGDASHASAHLLTVLNFLRHQHDVYSRPFVSSQLPVVTRFTVATDNGQLTNNSLAVFPTRPSAVRTTSALALSPSSGPALALTHAGFINRIRTGTARHGCFRVQDFPAVDPNLYANLAKCRFRFRQAIVDVGSQSVQGKLP